MTGPAERHVARYGERVVRALTDIAEHCDTAGRLVERGKAAYDADEMLRHAAEAILIRAGEGVDRIDKQGTSLVEDHPELELRRLKDARNLVAHGDDIVDHEILWSILQNNLPAVAEGIRRFLAT